MPRNGTDEFAKHSQLAATKHGVSVFVQAPRQRICGKKNLVHVSLKDPREGAERKIREFPVEQFWDITHHCSKRFGFLPIHAR